MKNGSSRKWFRLAHFFLIGCAICFSSCLSEIDLEVPGNNGDNLAIRGTLIGGELPYISITITTLSSFSASDIPEPLVGASVVLLDENNNGVDIPMLEDGLYELEIPANTYNLDIIAGNAYQLSVATPSGKNYVSTFEILHPVPSPSSITYTMANREVINDAGNILNQDFIRFFINTPLVSPNYSGKAYLKWNFMGTYRFMESTLNSSFPPTTKTCYFFDDLNLEKVVVFNGAENSGENLIGSFLLEEPFDYRFTDGFYLSVFQQSLSKGAFRYWDNIEDVVDLSGNFFDAPPGKVRGNFRNVDDETEEVFGYFHAAEEKLIRVYVSPGEDRVSPFCPLIAEPGDDSVLPVCLDCLTRSGSTVVKPEFWEE